MSISASVVLALLAVVVMASVLRKERCTVRLVLALGGLLLLVMAVRLGNIEMVKELAPFM